MIVRLVGECLFLACPHNSCGANKRYLVADGSTIVADEATHWDALQWAFETQRINHSEAYSHEGVHTNWVQSYFSRLRNMVEGQHFHVSPKYLQQYAEHAAWIEDHREEGLLELSEKIVDAALKAPKSETFGGYWQRAA